MDLSSSTHRPKDQAFMLDVKHKGNLSSTRPFLPDGSGRTDLTSSNNSNHSATSQPSDWLELEEDDVLSPLFGSLADTSTTPVCALPATTPRALQAPTLHDSRLLRNLHHFMAKHASELTFSLSSIAYIVTFYETRLDSTTILDVGSSAIMYFDALIAFAETARLLQVEDHHVFENRLKAAANFINGCQLAICSPPTLAATTLCPPATALALTSFTIGVLCESVLTYFEKRRAYAECELAYWLRDTMQAIDYFDKQIAALKKNAQTTTKRYQRLIDKRNDLLADLITRAKVFHEQPKDPQNPLDSEVRQLLSSFPTRFNTTAFPQWLQRQVAALNAADFFIITQPHRVTETQLYQRNCLLLDIEQRCQWALHQDAALETVIIQRTAEIINPFVLEKSAKRYQECIAHPVNFVRKDQTIDLNSEPTAYDRQKNQALQTQLESYHHLQKEMLRIKLLTCVSMSIVTIGAAATCVACPPAIVPIVLLAVVATYHITRHAKKLQQVAYETHHQVPKTLRTAASTPLLPPVATLAASKHSLGWPKFLKNIPMPHIGYTAVKPA